MYVWVMEKDISNFKESYMYIEKVLKYIIDVLFLLKREFKWLNKSKEWYFCFS